MVYINGKLVEDSAARVSVFDRGFLYGDSIFETMQVYKGGIIALKLHLDRLYNSAQRIFLEINRSREELRKAAYLTVRENGLTNAYLRLTVSRGHGEPGIGIKGCDRPTVVIFARNFSGYPLDYYENGVAVTIVSQKKIPDEAVPSTIKCGNFLNAILAKHEAKGYFEGIMTNMTGNLTEGTISNLFWITDGVLYTPGLKLGILPGITRKMVIDLARANSLQVCEGEYPVMSLLEADEVFITNSTLEIMPVTNMGAQRVGSGRPGPITKQLKAAFKLIKETGDLFD
ncbi:MAG: aminotransferase class IV [bacterium]